MSATYTICNCPKQDCPRFGNCVACRAFHLRAKRPRLPYCERGPSLLQRLLSALGLSAR